MEQYQYNYFTKLISFSFSHPIILIISSVIEITPIISFFLETPIIIKNYLSLSTDTLSIEKNIFSWCKNIFLYHLFTHLRDPNSNQYSILFLIIVIILISLFSLLFLIFGQKRNYYEKIEKEKVLFQTIKVFIFNAYDLLIFRCLSLFLLEILINYLCHNSSIAIAIPISLLLLIFILIITYYLTTFRLVLKFDKKCKYIFDNDYMLYYELLLLFQKILFCFDKNISNISISFTLNMFCIIISFHIIYLYLYESSINFIATMSCGYQLSFIFFVIINLLLPKLIFNKGMFILYFIFTVFCSQIIVGFLRYYKINQLFEIYTKKKNSITHYFFQFSVFCEYYDTPNFLSYLKKIKINKDSYLYLNNYNHNLSVYISLLEEVFKNYNKSKNKENNLYQQKGLFFYIMAKMYKEFVTNKKNSFDLMFQTWDILQLFKKTNIVYYINLKFYYQKLCDDYSSKNNCNFLLYNNSYYTLFAQINNILKCISKILQKKALITFEELLQFSNDIKTFRTETKSHYTLLTTSFNKDDYQRIIFRVIIEGILNKPICKTYNNCLINEDLVGYEEMLDRQYIMGKQLIMRIKLKNLEAKIIKVGKKFNHHLNEKFESIFPVEFHSVIKDLFYNKELLGHKDSIKYNFQFIIKDTNFNIKLFYYLYKLFPSLNSRIAYVDGFYQLGREDLLITKMENDKEVIFSISNNLRNYLYINQEYIDLLKKYDIKIYLNKFIKSYPFLQYSQKNLLIYISELEKNFLNICSKEDHEILSKVHKDIQGDNSKDNIIIKLKSQLNFTQDNRREFKVYSLQRIETGLTNDKDVTTLNYTEVEIIKNTMTIFTSEGMTNQLLGVIDNNSVSSSSNQLNSLNLSNNENLKKKMAQSENRKNNKIIVGLNFIGIALSIVCLIYENLLNNQLQKYTHLYQVTFNFNQYLLGNLINFYTLLPTFDLNKPGNAFPSIKRYFNEMNLTSLYDFIYYDLYESLELFPQKYLQFKTLIYETNIEELTSLLNTNISVFHIVYENKNFESSYYTTETFDHCIMYFVNKLITLVFSGNFMKETIYPIKLDDNYLPQSIKFEGDNLKKLSRTQTYVYEIMRNFFIYSNYFYELQLLLEDLIGNQISFNKSTLNFFIIGIFGINFCIYLMCSIFFRNFNQLIIKKANLCIYYLSLKDNISSLNKKIQIIEDLSRFYYKSPVKLINQLTNKTNNKKYLKGYTETDDKKEDNFPSDNQIKKYNVGFLTRKYISFLLLFGIIFILNLSSFIVMYHKSFDNLSKTSHFIEYSNYSEENTYLMINIIQIFEYLDVDGETLRKVLYNVIQNTMKLQSNFIVSLLNNIFMNNQQKSMLQGMLSLIPDDVEIFQISCQTLYKDLNDEKINTIFNKYPDEKFNDELVQFCSAVPSLQMGNDKLLFDLINYESMKYMLKDFTLNQNLNKLHSETQFLFLLSKVITIYKPYKSFLNNYYYEVLFHNQLSIHLIILLSFLMANIVLQIANFILINFGILNPIEKILKNIENIIRIFNCDDY